MYHRSEDEEALAEGLVRYGVLEFVPEEEVPLVGKEQLPLLNTWFGVGKGEMNKSGQEILRLIMNLMSNAIFQDIAEDTRTLLIFHMICFMC